MARIIRNAGPIADDAVLGEAELMATIYWGDLANERMFVIPFWQISQMLGISDSNEIALRVININDPNSMSAKWIVFEQSTADSLYDPVEMGIYYFVMNDSFFNGPILTATPPITQLAGMRNITATPQHNVIRARIGKNPSNDEYHVFFLAATCNFIEQGGGGGGVISGAKVPSN